jgi:hypothetical protein
VLTCSFIKDLVIFKIVYNKLKKYFKPQDNRVFIDYSDQLINILLARYSNIKEYILVFQHIQKKLVKLSDHAILQEY